MTSFSRRSGLELKKNALSLALDAQRAAGRELLSLVEGNPTLVGLSLDNAQLSALLASADSARYQPDPFGEPGARATIAAALSSAEAPITPAQVMLTASTSEAYGYLFKLLCDPGDRVLVPTPSYPLFDVLARYEGVELVPYPSRYDGEWHLDQHALAQAAQGAKAVLVVHPNNPTGHYLKRAELAELAALGLPIISDEVFAEYALRAATPERVASALEAAEHTLVFRLGGLSKQAALPQLKLAWTVIAGPPEARDEAIARLEHLADSFLSPATPVQRALPALLATAGGTQQRIRARCAENLRVLRGLLASGAASVLGVEGGWYAIVRLPAVLDDEQWALALLEQDGVLVQPGYFYDLGPGAHVVVSLITPEAYFAEGIRRLAARLASTIA